MQALSSALHYVYFRPCVDVLRIRNVAFSTWGSWAGEGGFTKWSILERVHVFVCGLHSETVSQREKINETGVTGTSPSAFAHMQGCSHAHALLARTHRRIPTHIQYAHAPLLHTAQPHSAPLRTRSGILMCSLRALLSVCVTFHPSPHHFQPHHQAEWKQFSAYSPSARWFIQSLHIGSDDIPQAPRFIIFP